MVNEQMDIKFKKIKNIGYFKRKKTETIMFPCWGAVMYIDSLGYNFKVVQYRNVIHVEK